MREDIVACFQDTLRISKQIFDEETTHSIQTNKVYLEGFASTKAKGNEHSSVIVEANTTFTSAKKYLALGKVAVLNFANPENPGGGVQNGAMAQEECLCRSSNLFACINDKTVFEDYYQYHRKLGHPFYSDRLIYTKDVKVFKDDSVVPVMLPESEWFNVDVITCAAPCLVNRKYTNMEALLRLFKGRIKNILEAARDNGVDVIILGAFGCGAFKNPPLVVAQAFEQTILEENYRSAFKQIVFAIKPTGERCPNFQTFHAQFDAYAPDGDKRCVLLGQKPSERFRRTPSLMTVNLSHNQAFAEWQQQNTYFGKQFSILGDSISTLEGYNPRGHAVFYYGENCVKSGVYAMQDTWWDKVIGFFGGELLVNNAWSGSRVTKLQNHTSLFPSGCCNERTSSLHINSVTPDVIIVYLGTNDWAFGAKTVNVTPAGDDDIHEYFSTAYDLMLKKLKKNYPLAEVWCCTISETFMSRNPSFHFPYKHAGIHTEVYNDMIRGAAYNNKCKLIDLYNCHNPYNSMDGSHPTKDGMETIAMEIIRSVAGREVEVLLDDVQNQDLYGRIEACVDGRSIGGRFPQEKVEDGKRTFGATTENSGYVLLDSDITTILYSNTFRLSAVDSEGTIQFSQDTVSVGKEVSNDLCLNMQNTISRHHATFLYEKGLWFLRDDGSTNGTWINGIRLEPGKKYQLASNDEINFARMKSFIFNEHKSKQVEVGDEAEDAVRLLEKSVSAFVASGHQDRTSFQIMLAALAVAPLYVPVLIDVEAMLGGSDPLKLRPGEMIRPSKEVKTKIFTLDFDHGEEIVPVYTSREEMEKGPGASSIRYYPSDLMPMLAQMNKRVAINPFGEYGLILKQSTISDILLSLVGKQDKLEEKRDGLNSDMMEGKIVEDRYELQKVVGKGGVFTVYLALDKRLNKQWAVKVCKKNDKNPVIANMALQEVYMVQKLNHPAIPKIVDFAEDAEHFYVIQEYVYGETLETLVRLHGAQPEETVINWAKQICDVMAYLHGLNPPHIYRDMKPANLILTPEGKIKMVDFGIMRQYKPGATEDETWLGTRGYAAPEQYGGRGQTDTRTDIYGIGATLYRLFTGIDLQEQPIMKSLAQVNPHLPMALHDIIMKCTETERNKRYQSCDELINALEGYCCVKHKKSFFEKLFGE